MRFSSNRVEHGRAFTARRLTTSTLLTRPWNASLGLHEIDEGPACQGHLPLLGIGHEVAGRWLRLLPQDFDDFAACEKVLHEDVRASRSFSIRRDCARRAHVLLAVGCFFGGRRSLAWRYWPEALVTPSACAAVQLAKSIAEFFPHQAGELQRAAKRVVMHQQRVRVAGVIHVDDDGAFDGNAVHACTIRLQERSPVCRIREFRQRR
jgi:hypothetical protein